MSRNEASVLILTPMKSTVRYLDLYFDLLERLTFPHARLSLGILEGDSDDGTWDEVARRLTERCSGFASRLLFKKDFGLRLPPGVPRYEPAFQATRRAVLARARNHLLFRALRDQDWVLWLDADVSAYPADVIERLVGLDLDIVHPHCVIGYGERTFDLNAWSDKGRLRMDDLRGKGRVRLDAVGGTMLLVRADRHRDGLVFPSFFYGGRSRWARDNNPINGNRVGEIETEGFGIMARDMGLECWGLPDLEILHPI